MRMKLKSLVNEKKAMLRTNLVIIMLNIVITIILMLANIHIMYVKGISLGVNITIIIQSIVSLAVDVHNMNYSKHNIKVILKYIEKEVK